MLVLRASSSVVTPLTRGKGSRSRTLFAPSSHPSHFTNSPPMPRNTGRSPRIPARAMLCFGFAASGHAAGGSIRLRRRHSAAAVCLERRAEPRDEFLPHAYLSAASLDAMCRRRVARAAQAPAPRRQPAQRKSDLDRSRPPRLRPGFSDSKPGKVYSPVTPADEAVSPNSDSDCRAEACGCACQ